MKRFLKTSFFWFTLLAIVLLSVSVWLTWWRWNWLHTSASTTASNSETLRNVGLLIGGLLAFVFAGWRAWVAERQADIAQSQTQTAQLSLLNERYQRGAEMLGSDVLSVRMGGIYALRRLAEDHPEQYHIQIMELLCAFVRNPTGDGGSPVYRYKDTGTVPRLREDVQSVMNIIGHRNEVGRNIEKATENFELNLRAADLQGIWLYGPDISDALLIDANLSHAMLDSADLSGATLTGANLSKSFLSSASLSNAKLAHANLSDAYLADADMSNAFLMSADLSKADCSNANLSRASLPDAKLFGSILRGTNVTHANFFSFGRTSAYESLGLGLTQAQLDEACCDPNDPPDLRGVLDAQTTAPLIWCGRTLDDIT